MPHPRNKETKPTIPDLLEANRRHTHPTKETMHQSFVTMGPHLRGREGDSRAKVLGNYFLIVPTMQGKCQGIDIRIPIQGRFSIAKDMEKEHSFESESEWFTGDTPN